MFTSKTNKGDPTRLIREALAAEEIAKLRACKLPTGKPTIAPYAPLGIAKGVTESLARAEIVARRAQLLPGLADILEPEPVDLTGDPHVLTPLAEAVEEGAIPEDRTGDLFEITTFGDPECDPRVYARKQAETYKDPDITRQSPGNATKPFNIRSTGTES